MNRIFRSIKKLAETIARNQQKAVAVLVVLIVSATSTSAIYLRGAIKPETKGYSIKASLTGAYLSILPNGYTVGVGQEFTSIVYLNGGASNISQLNQISSVGSYISFDPTMLQALSVEPFSQTSSFDFILEPNENSEKGRFDNARGKIRITAGEPGRPIFGYRVPVAKITFRALKTGSTVLNFDFSTPRSSLSKVITVSASGPVDILDGATSANYTIINK